MAIAYLSLVMIAQILNLLLFMTVLAPFALGQVVTSDVGNKVRSARAADCPQGLVASGHRTKLHTEYLRDLFGPTSVRVVKQKDNIRVVEIHAGGKVRTTAVSEFHHTLHPKIQEVHREVLAGGSMGQTFVRHGFRVSKRTVGKIYVQVKEDSRLVANVYEFWVLSDVLLEPQFYARVAEINSPEVTELVDPEEWPKMPMAPPVVKRHVLGLIKSHLN